MNPFCTVFTSILTAEMNFWINFASRAYVYYFQLVLGSRNLLVLARSACRKACKNNGFVDISQKVIDEVHMLCY